MKPLQSNWFCYSLRWGLPYPEAVSLRVVVCLVGPAYCQVIREPNKEKCVQECLCDSFENVIWSDETTVLIETHRRFCCKKKGSKPGPKHPIKVHVWGGISYLGATKV